VDWNRLTTDGVYDATKIYWFPNNFKSIDELWTYEEQEVIHKFVATVIEISENSVLVEPVVGEEELQSSHKISVNTASLGDIGVEVGSDVEIYYTGGIMETYPAQINAVNCAFTEWCFYDFVLDPDPDGGPFAGTTVLEDAAREDPSLKRLADTQFFSSFWVIKQDREHNLSLLREQTTCQDFIVHDPMIARRERWASGTLNARLALSDGIWETCGRCISHDNHETDPMPQRRGEGEPPKCDRARFILLTRDLQGVDGRYLQSMSAENIVPQSA
jgi:hypothetical protein